MSNDQVGVTICDFIGQMPYRSIKRTAVRYKKQNQWVQIDWTEFYTRIVAFALSLETLGVEKGARVALMSSTRWEWSVSDAAIMSLGGVTVPIYPSSTADEIEYIINHSQSEIVILENRSLLKKIITAKSKLQNLRHIIVIETTRSGDLEILSWESLLEKGRHDLQYRKNIIEESLRSVGINDLATIVYTSGTTGTPKGVALTHTQVMSEISDTFPLLGATPDDVFLTFLPYSHILGRIESWGHWYIGFEMAFAESIEALKDNLKEINPTILMAVPRIFEKIYSAVMTQVNSQLWIKIAFEQAQNFKKYYSEKNKNSKKSGSLFDDVGLYFSNMLMSKVKNIFGNRFRFSVCGGASLNKDIAEFFYHSGVLILEGYGLSETTAAVTVNRPYDYEFGTVGKPIGDVQIRLADDGELFIRSKKVMQSYYRNPEETEKVLSSDGWFATGDIAQWTAKGQIKIIDRKKDLIKTSGGKYIVPQKLQALIQTSPMVSHAHIHGEKRKYAVALITLNKEAVLKWAEDRQIKIESWETLSQKPEIIGVLRDHVAEVNSKLASFETIKRFSVIPNDFTVETGELTPSLKIKRRIVDEKYKTVIDALYE